MTLEKQIYKCTTCGNLVEVLHQGSGNLTCCGKPMDLREENTQEAAVEKHIPVVKIVENGVYVKVGEVEHPMIEEHYIEWIEIHTKNKVYRKYLKPGEKPEAIFNVNEEIIMVREYCNIHGLWKA